MFYRLKKVWPTQKNLTLAKKLTHAKNKKNSRQNPHDLADSIQLCYFRFTSFSLPFNKFTLFITICLLNIFILFSNKHKVENITEIN